MEMMMGGGMPGGSMPGAGRSAPRSAGRKDGRRGGRGSGEGDDEEMVRAMMEMMMGGGGGAMPSGGGEAGMAEMMAAMMAGGFDEDDEMIRGELGSLQLHSPVNESHIAPLILGVCVCVCSNGKWPSHEKGHCGRCSFRGHWTALHTQGRRGRVGHRV